MVRTRVCETCRMSSILIIYPIEDAVKDKYFNQFKSLSLIVAPHHVVVV